MVFKISSAASLDNLIQPIAPVQFHTREAAFVSGMTPPKFYVPTEFGLEAKIREKLEYLRGLDRKTGRKSSEGM